MLDFLTAGPFGLNCLVRTLIGFSCGFLKKILNTRPFLARVLIGFAVTVLKALILVLLAFIFPQGKIAVYDFFSLAFAVELGLNMIAAPILFAVLSLGKPFLLISSGEEET
jgi:rod shape-determining protein MreD